MRKYNLLQIFNIILNTEINITLHWNLAHCTLVVQTSKVKIYHIKAHSVQMTSLQSQYLLCPPLACNTAWIRLGIDSINRRIRYCGILPKFCSRACCSSCRVWGARWRLRTRRFKSPHKCSIGFKSDDLNGKGSTVTLWLAVWGRTLSCWITFLWRCIEGSMCGVKTSSLYRARWGCRECVLVLVGCFGLSIWHPTSSHFLRRTFRPQGRSSLRTSNSGVCTHMYGHLFSAAWTLIHRWTRHASSFAGHSPLRCCTIGPLQVHADISVLRQSKDVWPVNRFHGDDFWLSVAIFVWDLGNAVFLAVTVRFLMWGTRFSDLGLLMCPCCAKG